MAICVLHIAEAAGGVERYLHGLFKYTKQDIENILMCSQNFDEDNFKPYAKKIIKINMAHDIAPNKDIQAVASIRRVVKKFQPDIVYAHSSKAGALARLACLFSSVPVIYNPHGWAFNMRQSKKKKEVYRIIERIQSPFTKKIICISEAEKSSALNNKICNKKKLCVINNGIDFSEFNKEKITREKLNIPNSSFVVGQVGRLTDQKSPDIFIKSAALIKRKIPNAFFVLVGDGELRPRMEKLIKSEGLEKDFLITGWVDNSTSYLDVFDVATLLSRWEGFGLVLPEYMYSKIPIVATEVDAIPYIIKDGVNGLLVKPNNPVNVATAIEQIYYDSKLKSTLVENGRMIVEQKYDVRRVANETIQMYEEIKC